MYTSVKILFPKQDIRTTDGESKSLELSTSFEESERRQNVLGKCDAPALGEQLCRLGTGVALDERPWLKAGCAPGSTPSTTISERKTRNCSQRI